MNHQKDKNYKKAVIRIALLIVIAGILIALGFFSGNQDNEFSLPKIIETQKKYQSRLDAHDKEKTQRKSSFQSPKLQTNEKTQGEVPFDPINLEGKRKENETQIVKKQINPTPPSIAKTKKKSPSLKKGKLIAKHKPLEIKKPIEEKPLLTQEQIEKQKREELRKHFQSIEDNKRIKERIKEEKVDIQAEIPYDQSIVSGKTIALKLLEPVLIKDFVIPKGNYIYGVCSFEKYRIKVTFSHVELEGKLLPFDRKLYDLDGFEGIAITDNNTLKQLEGELSDQAMKVDQYMDLSSSEGSGKVIKAVGGVFEKIISKKKRQIKIHLDEGHRVFLKNKNLSHFKEVHP